MKTIIHKAGTRGHADYGWLKTNYTFSFANYYDPRRVHFGCLRVLNDDFIEAGKGFDRHPHDNMEIVTIPLEGKLEHKDSMGNTMQILSGDVQIMSAGTGIFHSEYNPDPVHNLRLLQIWIFPKTKNITPRYDQKTYDRTARKNRWQRVVSPTEKEAVWINQDAWFSLISLEKGKNAEYAFQNAGNGAYVFMIEGSAAVSGTQLDRRDGAGFSETGSLELTALENSEILLMEIPMQA
ncbi:MAG: pirin family protein [Bacteroidetes bacterium]|nr:pirin family protein [Bacteroidota bacterium]